MSVRVGLASPQDGFCNACNKPSVIVAQLDSLRFRFCRECLDSFERQAACIVPPMFVHGARVKLKNPEPGRAIVGEVRNRPSRHARTVEVRWPDGWAGHVRVDELEPAHDQG